MKKLINILSTISLIALTGLSTISCNEKEPNLSLKQEETYIVKALIQKQPNNFKEFNINDILPNPILVYDNKNHKINYDIKLKQNTNTSVNNYHYRITNLKGNFTLIHEKISNNNFSLSYLPGNYQNYINKVDNILTGTNDDFTIIMNSSDWMQFINWISHDTKYAKYDGGNAYLHYLNLFNPKITLTNNEWHSITNTLTVKVDDGYAACIHVIKQNGNFKIAYNNLTIRNWKNMPLPTDGPWLPLFAFQSDAITDGSVLSEKNKFITLNKDMLKELKDIYTDKNTYHKTNWNILTLSKLLQDNNYCNTNLDYKTIASCIYHSLNIKLLNNLLDSNHNYFTLQYDQNNHYINNNWNI